MHVPAVVREGNLHIAAHGSSRGTVQVDPGGVAGQAAAAFAVGLLLNVLADGLKFAA